MIGPGDLIAICQTALEKAPPLLKKLQAMRHTKEEIDLLVAAAKPGRDQGTFHIVNLNLATIPLVRAGGSYFSKDEDVAACARYEKAFRSLCERGYVQPRSEEFSEGITYFTLTAAGFEKAGKLSSD